MEDDQKKSDFFFENWPKLRLPDKEKVIISKSLLKEVLCKLGSGLIFANSITSFTKYFINRLPGSVFLFQCFLFTLTLFSGPRFFGSVYMAETKHFIYKYEDELLEIKRQIELRKLLMSNKHNKNAGYDSDIKILKLMKSNQLDDKENYPSGNSKNEYFGNGWENENLSIRTESSKKYNEINGNRFKISYLNKKEQDEDLFSRQSEENQSRTGLSESATPDYQGPYDFYIQQARRIKKQSK